MTQPPAGQPPRGPHPPRGHRGARRVRPSAGRPRLRSAPGGFGPPQGPPTAPRGAPPGPPHGARQGPLLGPPPPPPQGGACSREGPAARPSRSSPPMLVGAGAGRLRGVEARRPGAGDTSDARLRTAGTPRQAPRRPAPLVSGDRPQRRARRRRLDRPRHRRRPSGGVYDSRLLAGVPKSCWVTDSLNEKLSRGPPATTAGTRPRASPRRSGRPTDGAATFPRQGRSAGDEAFCTTPDETLFCRAAGALVRRGGTLIYVGIDRGGRGRRRGLRAGRQARREGPLTGDGPVTAGRGLPIGKAHLPSPHRRMTVAEIVHLLGPRHPRPT